MVKTNLSDYIFKCYEMIPKDDIILRAQFLSLVLEQPAKYRIYSSSDTEDLKEMYRDTIRDLEPIFYERMRLKDT